MSDAPFVDRSAAVVLRFFHLHDATPAERRATWWTAVAFFGVLAAYYLLRPLRENVAKAFGEDRLLQLFLLTFVFITLLNPVWMALVRRLPTRRLVPYALHAFAASFLLLGWPLHGGSPQGAWAMVFYSWVTAFSVCGVTVVWVHAVDWFRSDQGKRLFGFVSLGGTLGAIVGSWLSGMLAGADGSWRWLRDPGVQVVLAAVWIECALFGWWCSLRACRLMAPERASAPAAAAPASAGSVLTGLQLTVRVPYLRGALLFVLLSSISATTFYFQQIHMVKPQLPDAAASQRYFAEVNYWQNVLCLVLQLFATSRVLSRFGVGAALSVMPAFSLLGLVGLTVWPTVAVFAVVEVSRRMLQFAFDKPAREVLYTPLDVESKYAAKAFIDTAGMRFGDLVGAVANDLLVRAGAGTTAVAVGAVPFGFGWLLLGRWLGRRCQARERAAGHAGAF